MKIINFGSLNIDHVYRVKDFVTPGETIASDSYELFCGGKGCNQSVALSLAGAEILHASKIGSDGSVLKEKLSKAGVDTSVIENSSQPTGHAIIQVSNSGENSIIIHGGANRDLSKDYIGKVLEKADREDYVLTQNETSGVSEIIDQAFAKGLKVVFNPAPITPEVNDYPLDKVSILIVNETEGAELSGFTAPDEILSLLAACYPNATIVLTLGAEGVAIKNANEELQISAEKVKVVDTTAAGDTFIGYFLAEFTKGSSVEDSAIIACKAAAICVQTMGATDSIPLKDSLSLLIS